MRARYFVEQSHVSKLWYVREQETSAIVLERETRKGAENAMRRLNANVEAMGRTRECKTIKYVLAHVTRHDVDWFGREVTVVPFGELITRFAEALAAQNPQFDVAKFHRSCRYDHTVK